MDHIYKFFEDKADMLSNSEQFDKGKLKKVINKPPDSNKNK